ncbi:hypothetical protein Tco_1068443 [Tanacetum coccineum]|uniref:Uncharacterized protein n=1 Tax=Tanacetum coccineum TaxID=301880 RepID=A0ABQ5HH69_9ASTR
MTTESNDVRRSTLRRPREELEADVALANNLLDLLTRYLEQMRSRGLEMLRVESLPSPCQLQFAYSAKDDWKQYEKLQQLGGA